MSHQTSAKPPVFHRVVAKQKTREKLELEVYSPSPEGRKWGCLVAVLYLAWSVISLGAGFTFFVLGQALAVLLLISSAERSEKPVLYTIEFNALKNRCLVQGSKGNSTIAICISKIQGVSMYVTRKVYTGGQAPAYHGIYSHSLYGVMIQAERVYKLQWELTERDCTWLIDQIRSWLALQPDQNREKPEINQQ